MQQNTQPDDAKPLIDAFYEHPLIRNLAAKPGGAGPGQPSYIPSNTFAIVLLDVLREPKTTGDALGVSELLANARQSLASVSDPELKRVLTLLVGDTEHLAADINQRSKLVSERLEAWFNDRMARASGWYKRRAQAWSLVLALGVTIAFNADTFAFARRLWSDGALRESVVSAAQTLSRQEVLQTTALPLGWHDLPPSATAWLLRAAGWLVTALAVSLGAGFWFDVLGKALRLRGTGGRVSTTTGKVEGTTAEVAP